MGRQSGGEGELRPAWRRVARGTGHSRQVEGEFRLAGAVVTGHRRRAKAWLKAALAELFVDLRPVGDSGQHLAASATWAVEHLNPERLAQQRRPVQAWRPGARREGSGRQRQRRLRLHWCRSRRRSPVGHDRASVAGRRGKHSVEVHQVLAPRRRHCRQLLEQLQGRHQQHVPPAHGPLHAVRERPVVASTQAGTTSTCAPLLGIPFGFHSAFKSSATGLLYFRNRWYSSVSGEWLSQDPLGPVDSHNLFAFNGLDAVNFRDPRGLSKNGAASAGDDTFDPLDPNAPVVPGSGRRVVREKCGVAGCVADPDPKPTSATGGGGGSSIDANAVADRAEGRSERNVGGVNPSSSVVGLVMGAGPRPSTQKAAPVFKVDSQLFDAPKIAKAVKLAEAEIAKLPNSILLHGRTKNFVKNELGQTQVRLEEFVLNFDLRLPGDALVVSHVPKLPRDSLGETPSLAVAKMTIATHWLDSQSTEEIARTFVHEWAHNMINRNLQAQKDADLAYDVVSRQTISIDFLDPVTGAWTPV